MADSKAYGHLSVTPPNQISKDVPGSENSIPLSPQWLLPKPGESKVGMAPGGNHSSPYSGTKSQEDTGNFPAGGEKVNDSHKKKAVYRPSFLESDRWHDEERETNVSIRRDRWREGDKELGDTRKMERWANNSPAKISGEARRPPSDRWVDPSKEAAFDQRRESKWNSRWGPSGKEMDTSGDFGKPVDASHERGVSHLMIHEKEERAADHARPWRPSSALSRGRTNSTGRGHGHGDNAYPTFSVGRGRNDSDMNSTAKMPALGQTTYKADHGHGKPSSYGHDRAKMLDIYRATNMRLFPKLLNGFKEVPSLTQPDPVEPLAFSAPTHEELDIFKGIDKGDITSSGAPQKSKDGSLGQGSSDFVQTRRPRLGSRDDVTLPDDGSNYNSGDATDVYSSFSAGSFQGKQSTISGSRSKMEFIENEFGYADNKHNIEALRDGPSGMVNHMPGNSPAEPWKSSADHAHSSTHGGFGAAGQSKASEIGWSESQKKLSGLAEPSYPQNEQQWQTGEDPGIRRQQSVLVDREAEARKQFQPSPEELLLYYKDPQGQVQGPFSGVDVIEWFEAGYFGIDLLVRPVNASPDSPFSLLGDVMPHLRAKVRPPPGFSASKPNELPYISNVLATSNMGKVPTGLSGIDMLRNEHTHSHGSMTGTENRFLESLMSNSMTSSPHVSQGYAARNSSALPPLGMESGDSLNLWANRLMVERQKSLANSYPNWPEKDAPLNVPHSEMLQDSSISQPSQSQNVGLPDSSTGSVHNGAVGWSNFPVQGGLDSFNLKQNLSPQVLGLLQQRVLPQNPQISSLLGQTTDIPSNVLIPEMLNSSSLSQDPQILNLLHQRHILQMQPQTAATAQQLAMVDKILLIKHQQNQEEQLRLQQQQQLLSQLLIDQQQRLSELPYAHLPPTMSASVHAPSAAVSAGTTPIDHLRQRAPQQILQVTPEFSISSLQEDKNAVYVNTNHPVSEETSYSDAPETSSLYFPQQILGQSWAQDTTQNGEIQPNSTSKPEVAETFQSDLVSQELRTHTKTEIPHAKLSESTIENETIITERDNDNTSLSSASPCIKEEQSSNVISVIKEDVKHVDAPEVKKTSEKKSRKQKSSKVQTSSEQVKGAAKLSTKSDLLVDKNQEAVKETEESSKAVEKTKSSVHVEQKTTADNSVPQVWKSTVNVKPKTLKEIQEEEERNLRKLKAEIAVSAVSSSVSSLNLSAPWAGVISGSDQKVGQENIQGETNISKTEKKKSQLHDLLAAEVLAKSNEKTVVVDSGYSLPPLPLSSSQSDAVDDDFIEAKDTKKSRKKAAKNKAAAGSKSSTSSSIVDTAVSSSPIEKGKSLKKVQQESEVLPAPPMGPSLGDFVQWKGEATSPTPLPAWSTDSAKTAKPLSLRNILLEEEKRGVPTQKQQFPAPQKSLPKASAPVQASSLASSQTKYKGDDDLFWGPPEQSTQEINNRPDFPQLGNSGNWGTKGTPAKSPAGASLTHQKSAGRKAAQILSSPASSQLPLKAKRGGDSKHSEAMEFRSWCEGESVRLTGSNDTSFLEFCVKQSRSEAKILLVQNLGSVDPNHKFIEKFLDYMDMLPSDVLNLAFQGQNGQKPPTPYTNRDPTSDRTSMADPDISATTVDSSTKGGKKKGKKGKKVSPLVLGFNVVSNRIMMGEIQTIDD